LRNTSVEGKMRACYHVFAIMLLAVMVAADKDGRHGGKGDGGRPSRPDRPEPPQHRPPITGNRTGHHHGEVHNETDDFHEVNNSSFAPRPPKKGGHNRPGGRHSLRIANIQAAQASISYLLHDGDRPTTIIGVLHNETEHEHRHGNRTEELKPVHPPWNPPRPTPPPRRPAPPGGRPRPHNDGHHDHHHANARGSSRGHGQKPRKSHK
jgi:hypothetical protein